MKENDLKVLATKIANAEKIIQNSKDSIEVEKAKNDIYELSGQITSMDDFFAIDELVQEILS